MKEYSTNKSLNMLINSVIDQETKALKELLSYLVKAAYEEGFQDAYNDPTNRYGDVGWTHSINYGRLKEVLNEKSS